MSNPQPLSWTWGRLESLTSTDVYDTLALRSEVFVVEQHCVYLDPDGVDRQSWHLLGRGQGGALLASLRLVDPGVKYAEPSIGRVVDAASVRRSGVGLALMSEGIRRCELHWPGQGIRISAQAHLQPFYSRLGFQTVSEPYLEDDIPHVQMWRASR